MQQGPPAPTAGSLGSALLCLGPYVSHMICSTSQGKRQPLLDTPLPARTWTRGMQLHRLASLSLSPSPGAPCLQAWAQRLEQMASQVQGPLYFLWVRCGIGRGAKEALWRDRVADSGRWQCLKLACAACLLASTIHPGVLCA